MLFSNDFGENLESLVKTWNGALWENPLRVVFFSPLGWTPMVGGMSLSWERFRVGFVLISFQTGSPKNDKGHIRRRWQ